VREALFWLIVAVFAGGQLLLVRSAWRLRRGAAELPPGVPQSDGRADLAWTLATAALTFLMLYFAYQALV
jgi:cytochrome b561